MTQPGKDKKQQESAVHFRIENIEAFNSDDLVGAVPDLTTDFLRAAGLRRQWNEKSTIRPVQAPRRVSGIQHLVRKVKHLGPPRKIPAMTARSCSKEQPLKRNRPGEMERPRKTRARGQSLESIALEGRGECCLHNVKKDGGPREDGQDKCATMSWERDVEMKIARSMVALYI